MMPVVLVVRVVRGLFGCPVCVIRGSEREPNRSLHDTRGTRRQRLSEARVDLLARRVELRVGVERQPVHLIEDIVGFPAELQPLATAKLEVLEDGHVRQDNLWQLEERHRRVSDVSTTGQPAERRHVEVASRPARSGVAVAAAAQRIATDIWPGSAVTASEVEVVGRGRGCARPVAADPGRVAGELPAVEKSSRKDVVPHAASVRHIPGVVDDEGVLLGGS